MSSKPEKGGPTTQAGIYFQNCITVLRLAEMLCEGQLAPSSSGRIISVRTEAPEEVDDTVVTWSSGRKEYIQAKLSVSPRSKAWKPLWNHFYQQYDSSDFDRAPNGDTITLAVNWTPQMVELKGLLMRARTADSEEEWIRRSTGGQRKLLEDVKTILGIDDETLFQFCRFVQMWLLAFEGDPMETDTFERETCRKLRGVVEPTTNVFSVLIDLVGRTARVRGTWKHNDLVHYLERSGFRVLTSAAPSPPSEFQLLQPNPYVVGPPLRSPTDLFVGRDALIDTILWRVHKHSADKMAPNAVLLYGPHRSGKTSILCQLGHRIGHGFRPILVDLNGISLTTRLPDVLEDIAVRVEMRLEMEGIDIDTPSHSEFVSQPAMSMAKFMRRIVSACAPKKPILMFDESDALSSFTEDLKITRKFLSFMRSVIEHNRDVFFIFASCRDIRYLADPGMSRLLTLMDDCLRVDLLSESETVALILEPVCEYFTYTQDAVTHIVELSGRHPWVIQLICREAVDWRNRQRVNWVTLKALDDIIPKAIARSHEQFMDFWWGLIRNEQVMVYAISQTLRDAGIATPESVQTQLSALQLNVVDWNLTVDRLLHIGLIDVREGYFRMQLGLLKHWIYRTPMNTLLPQRSIDGIMQGVN
jgi:hypothetical protein